MSDRRLLEEWLPIAALGERSVRARRSITALPPTYSLHVWWARRPLVASRVAVLASLLPVGADRAKFLHILGIHGDRVSSRRCIDLARRKGERFEGGLHLQAGGPLMGQLSLSGRSEPLGNWSTSPAAFRAILHVVPHGCPLSAPAESPTAGHAWLRREIFWFHHREFGHGSHPLQRVGSESVPVRSRKPPRSGLSGLPQPESGSGRRRNTGVFPCHRTGAECADDSRISFHLCGSSEYRW